MAAILDKALAAEDRFAGIATPSRVSIDDLKARAHALVPTLRARAERTERERRVSEESTQMLRDAELFKLMQPARFGGFEYGFTDFIDVNIEIGQGCGNTAWCASLGMVHQWLVALFPLEAQQEVWEDPSTIVAGSYAPAGKCESVPGGYRISGKWAFASNCDNAGWYLLGVMFPPEEEGSRAQPGFLLVPRTQTSIEDTWFTVGLAGTGSKTIVVSDEIFVPRYRRLLFAEASSNNPPGSRVHANPIYRIPFLAALPVCLASPGLGIVQGAINEFLEWIGSRTTRGAVSGGGNPVAHFPQVQSRLAEASAALDAAKFLLQRGTRDVELGAASGEFISVDKRIRNRRDQGYATKLAVSAVNVLFEAVGGGGLHLSSGIQRAWRDVNAIGRHISLNWDAVSTMYGQYQFGLEPKGQY
jgi:resorcinol 4-hydroxylase (FADH2)